MVKDVRDVFRRLRDGVADPVATSIEKVCLECNKPAGCKTNFAHHICCSGRIKFKSVLEKETVAKLRTAIDKYIRDTRRGAGPSGAAGSSSSGEATEGGGGRWGASSGNTRTSLS